jgi:hypothetical protein
MADIDGAPDPGMWGVVQAAVTAGWQATARLCLVMLVRYGPRCGLGLAAIKVLQVLGRHPGQ